MIPVKKAKLADHPANGAWPTSGILIHGQFGSGRRTLAKAIANEAGYSFHEVSAYSLLSEIPGETAKNIREVFSKAHAKTPSVLYIDDINVIGSKKGIRERCFVAQLITCLDLYKGYVKPHEALKPSGYVLVIVGMQTSYCILDPDLQRAGRLQEGFDIDTPDENDRFKILKKLTHGHTLDSIGGDEGLRKLAREYDFAGAELERVVQGAAGGTMKEYEKKRKREETHEN